MTLPRHMTLACLGLVCLLACPMEESGDDDDDDDGSGGTDTRYHAPPDGTHMGEMAACDALRNAFQDTAVQLKCSKTVRTCPGFVRANYDPDCVEYDQGSVQGCAEYYGSVASCQALVDTDCVVTVYPGTEPAGCN
jgi:hypothetical protein